MEVTSIAFVVVVIVESLSCVRLLWPHGQQPTRLLCPWDFPGKNTGAGYHFLLQGIFLTQGSNSSFMHCQADSLLLSLATLQSTWIIRALGTLPWAPVVARGWAKTH